MVSEAIQNQGQGQHAPRRGSLPLLACAALILAGCSSEPLPPHGTIWTGSSNARPATATLAAPANYDARPPRRIAGGGDWGPYSGRRGQTEPPAETDYAFKGDPNASPTFAAGPGQM